jgi:chromosome segregation ATPase
VNASNPSPQLRLELRHGTAQPHFFDVPGAAFVVGSVPGCDLRLPGANLPPVICVIERRSAAVAVRKLARTQPLLVNGENITSAALHNGDRVTVGPVDLVVHVDLLEAPEGEPAINLGAPASITERVRRLDVRQRQLDEQTHELEADRVIWYRRREQIERECAERKDAAATETRRLQEQQRDLEAARAELEQQSTAAARERTEWTERSQELTAARSEHAAQAERLARREQELAAARTELVDIRQRLYNRYRARRDRLTALQEAVNLAARKVQERKRALEVELQQAATRQQELTAWEADLGTREEALASDRRRFEEERRQLAGREQTLHDQAAQQAADSAQRQHELASQRQMLAKNQAEHQADLLRLDRARAHLELRQQQLEARAPELDQRFEQLQRDRQEIEDKARQLEELRVQLGAEADRVAQLKTEQEAANAQLAQRGAAVEGHQAMFAALRTRLERMREELHREQQQLAEQRTQLETTEADLRQRAQEVERLRAEWEHEQQARERERRQFEERSALMETAAGQMRALQEHLLAEEERLRQREQTLEAEAVRHAEQDSLLQAQAVQVAELTERLTMARQTLRDRESALAQAEQAREALQEQLRRRSEELNARQRAVAAQERQQEVQVAALESQRADLERQYKQTESRLEELRKEVEQGATDIARREETLARHVERLKQAGLALGGQRKSLFAERAQVEAEHRRQTEAADKFRAEVGTARREAAELHSQLPELEQRAQAASDRLFKAREQLRDHLAELHAYARQSHQDLDLWRAQVQTEAEAVRQHELTLHRTREEQRLAVAAFRQQLIDWQGQVADMKRALAQDESRIERRQALVDEQSRQVDASSARLAKQAEQLEAQERVVAERRDEVERHLNEMREWYRRKLRELTGRHSEDEALPGDRAAEPEGRHDILALTGDPPPGDRQLGELLRSLDLVDADTLTALLVEARKQRRSLRQLLLAGGYLTLYQIALIEAGTLDALVLGPVRVIDRLRVTPRETVYRVFDPRRGHEAVLRHLAEAEAQDAVRPDEFRQRFGHAARVQHPHVAITLEVLEIAGRPAVLQEPLAGLPSSDWPPLAAVPGVCHRLLCQAALGLHTVHQAGLLHGHLQPGLIVLTAEGIVKLCGLGEPPWLNVGILPEAAESVAGDLTALGQIAASWTNLAPQRKPAKIKPLLTILQRLVASEVEARYPAAAALLQDLEAAGADLPPNAEAWDRLLHYVREHDSATALRQSA